MITKRTPLSGQDFGALFVSKYGVGGTVDETESRNYQKAIRR